MTVPKFAIVYKEFYNKNRGLPEPIWGEKLPQSNCDYPCQCPTCGSPDMYYSGTPDNPEEVSSDVRCGHCGHITDYYEAFKQRIYHSTDTLREVVGRP